jgi:hypothetical protein
MKMTCHTFHTNHDIKPIQNPNGSITVLEVSQFHDSREVKGKFLHNVDLKKSGFDSHIKEVRPGDSPNIGREWHVETWDGLKLWQADWIPATKISAKST